MNEVNVHGVSDSKTRSYLFNLVNTFPGLYFREISRVSSFPIGTLDFNLRKLEKFKHLASQVIWGKKRYFPFSLPDCERKVIGILRERNARKIIELIQNNSLIKYADISSALKVSKPTVNWYLSRLKNEGLIAVRNENNRAFFIVEHWHIVGSMLEKYKESFSDKMLSNFVAMWEG